MFSLANSALNARSYSLNAAQVEKPAYAQARFGFSGGGQLHIPKIVNSPKTFVFFNYSGARSRNGTNLSSTMPSALERAGDFSQSAVQVFDPQTKL